MGGRCFRGGAGNSLNSNITGWRVEVEVELRRNDLHVSEQTQLKLLFAGLQEI